MSIRGLCSAAWGALAACVMAGAPALAWAEERVGQPTDGALGLQPAASDIKESVHWFHDVILLPVEIGISLFVLALLVLVVVRFNKRANPTPAKFSHNTLLEIVWTAVPILILVFIAFFSMSLLRKYNDMPPADVVVKATGNQWYWTYDYPELGVEGVESRLLPAASQLDTARQANVPYLLETDNRLIVPIGKVVHLQVTATDVIHSFALPAFGLKTDAIPGRLNDTWFKAEKTGMFYGQCSELCGKDHAYMPIQIEVVSQEAFDAFIVSKGGKTRAMIAAEAAAAEAANSAASSEVSSEAAPAAEAAVPAATAAPVTAPKPKPAAAVVPAATASSAAPAAQ